MKRIFNNRTLSMLMIVLGAFFLAERAHSTKAARLSGGNDVYLPLILNNYKTPPHSTISYYMGFNGYAQPHNLTWQKLYNMGCEHGNSMHPGSSGYVVLSFGKPWYDGNTYGTLVYDELLTWPYHSFISNSTIEYLVQGFLTGYWYCSPSDTRLNLAIGTTNQGSYVNYTSGYRWGDVVNHLVTWIAKPPSWESKLGVVGAIDSELDWNTATNSLDWRSGYAINATRFYLYYGSCAGCPTEEYYWWAPNNNWTLYQVRQMSGAYSSTFPLPQIYSKNRLNAQQWRYLSLHAGRLDFMGTITEWLACQERSNCYSGDPDFAIDNTPGEGWEQLWGELYSDPYTRQEDIPVSTDISW